ncbi:YraN family protein [Parapedobacter lycopersici]|uniref:YraN family protein n=1 Tax=Parapedobacter lycopersici TaxID=1864939 RepID=UPI003340045E
MQGNQQKGRDGEAIAVQLLKQQGYEIICLNWRHKHLEVDIIARDGNHLVFVEVKTRLSSNFGMPHEAVDWVKQGRLTRAAERYILAHRHEGEIRFDVVSVLYSADRKSYRTELIKDAFWPD